MNRKNKSSNFFSDNVYISYGLRSFFRRHKFQIILIFCSIFILLSVPLTVKLAQLNQDNRSRAAQFVDCDNQCLLDGGSRESCCVEVGVGDVEAPRQCNHNDLPDCNGTVKGNTKSGCRCEETTSTVTPAISKCYPEGKSACYYPGYVLYCENGRWVERRVKSGECQCSIECDISPNAPNNGGCGANKHCQRDPYCSGSADYNAKCVDNEIKTMTPTPVPKACDSIGCDAGFVCMESNLRFEKCKKAENYCDSNFDCGGSYKCSNHICSPDSNNVCIDECSNDSQCPSGKTCTGYASCFSNDNHIIGNSRFCKIVANRETRFPSQNNVPCTGEEMKACGGTSCIATDFYDNEKEVVWRHSYSCNGKTTYSNPTDALKCTKSNGECPLGYYCNEERGSCAKGFYYCSEAEPCPDGFTCTNSSCHFNMNTAISGSGTYDDVCNSKEAEKCAPGVPCTVTVAWTTYDELDINHPAYQKVMRGTPSCVSKAAADAVTKPAENFLQNPLQYIWNNIFGWPK